MSTKKEGGLRGGIAAPTSAESASLIGGPGGHFLHFEITVNRNTALKIIAGSWSDAKRVKIAEKQKREG